MVLANKVVILVILVLIKVDNSVASRLPMIQNVGDSASEGCTIAHDHNKTQDFSLASELNKKDDNNALEVNQENFQSQLCKQFLETKVDSTSASKEPFPSSILEASLGLKIPLPPWDILAVISLLVLFFLGKNNEILALPALIIICAVAYQFKRLQN